MAQRLTIDEVSAKTLPHLDKLYLTGETDKLSAILAKTDGAALRRLTLAAIARHKVLAPAELQYADTSSGRLTALLEELVKMNLMNSSDEIPMVLDQTGTAESLVLYCSIIRFCNIDNAS